MSPSLRATIKRLLTATLYFSGVAWLVSAWLFRRRALVLMYHRVLPDRPAPDAYSADAIVVTPETFERHMRFLRRFFTPVDGEQLRAMLRGEAPWQPRACLVTFDDGWFDNFEHALPVLRRERVPVHRVRRHRLRRHARDVLAGAAHAAAVPRLAARQSLATPAHRARYARHSRARRRRGAPRSALPRHRAQAAQHRRDRRTDRTHHRGAARGGRRPRRQRRRSLHDLGAGGRAQGEQGRDAGLARAFARAADVDRFRGSALGTAALQRGTAAARRHAAVVLRVSQRQL